MEDSKDTNSVRFGAMEETVREATEDGASDILFDDGKKVRMSANAANRGGDNGDEFVAKACALRYVQACASTSSRRATG